MAAFTNSSNWVDDAVLIEQLRNYYESNPRRYRGIIESVESGSAGITDEARTVGPKKDHFPLWTRYTDGNGYFYFIHEQTGESRWELPASAGGLYIDGDEFEPMEGSSSHGRYYIERAEETAPESFKISVEELSTTKLEGTNSVAGKQFSKAGEGNFSTKSLVSRGEGVPVTRKPPTLSSDSRSMGYSRNAGMDDNVPIVVVGTPVARKLSSEEMLALDREKAARRGRETAEESMLLRLSSHSDLSSSTNSDTGKNAHVSTGRVDTYASSLRTSPGKLTRAISLCSGYLVQKCGIFKRKRTRYFELQGDCLAFGKSRDAMRNDKNIKRIYTTQMVSVCKFGGSEFGVILQSNKILKLQTGGTKGQGKKKAQEPGNTVDEWISQINNMGVGSSSVSVVPEYNTDQMADAHLSSDEESSSSDETNSDSD
jgi:hypothetical protein